MTLPQRFDPSEAEPRLYAGWEVSGAFAAGTRPDAEPFTVMIPPPNVTGSLHVGHALTMTMQDVLVRYRRMRGRDVLWMPGMDHAGIATQMVVERELAREQTTRQAIGRDAFTERVWRWKAESGGAITTQLRRLGASLDWPRERFTMDDGLSAAVRATFVKLHREGLIYRDRRLVNWDPKFGTAISDLEVESRELRGHLWHIRYPLADGSGSITVATTRPETMLGDTAVAVHPEDSRYTGLIGRSVVLPITGRTIPIVADTYSDPEKGTGAVKITPAHDFNDFEVGRRHALEMPSVIDRAGRITLAEIGGATTEFLRSIDGMDRDEARRTIAAELERLEVLVAVEPHTHTVPHGDRSGVVIEPLLTVQWYCDAATLAKPAVEAVEQGRTVFAPRQWENTFFAWMREIEPWCISRQLWWGHRIPAWYGPDGTVFVEENEAAALAAAHAHYGRDETLERDPDVLDTWFSSALWPFSTLGWPEKTADLARFYPGDVLVTAYDIIFFWVARMMMMGLYLMGDVPFRTVAIHGLVRDERGQKMSKSKGNVIDPLALIDQYGADALRFTVASLCGPGRDVKLGAQKVEAQRGFVTKIWNAARFGELNRFAPLAVLDPAEATLPLSRWLLTEANGAVAACTAALDDYRLDEYAAAAYRFTWGTYCDWFLELAKYGLQGADAAELRRVGGHVFGIVLRLLHPVMPFVTEALWNELGYGEAASLIRTAWPEAVVVEGAAAASAEIDWVVRLIGTVRTVRSEMGVAPSVLAPVLLRHADPTDLSRGQAWTEAIARMARASEFGPLVGEPPRGSAQAVLDRATIVIPLAGLIDLDAERARLGKDRARGQKDAEAAAKKLDNPDFLARANPDVVAEIRERLDAAKSEIARIDAALARIVE